MTETSGFLRRNNGVGCFAVAGWRGYDWLWHGFSTHVGGVSRVYLGDGAEGDGELGQLNLGFTGADDPESVRENRFRWAEAITGSRETPIRTVRQVHSNRIVTALEAVAATAPEADGLVTDGTGFLLGVLTADCIPVLVADPVRRAVGAFHAGWRGTLAGVVVAGIGRMGVEFGCDPGQLVAAIGPGIGACCYTVGSEVRELFEREFSYGEELFEEDGGGHRLDLTEANLRQLLAAGLAPAAIAEVGGCTGCHPELFYSHRASGGQAGRLMAVIGIGG